MKNVVANRGRRPGPVLAISDARQDLSWPTVIATLLMLLAAPVQAQSWPTYRHDNRRSGVTEHELSFPIEQHWVRRSEQPPQAAWTGPAKWDAWAGNSGLQSMRNFDPCFFVTVVDGRVFFGSSVDDAVHCLDASSGQENWIYFTGAAVRLPPTIDEGRVYFGSDDGNVYCCDAKSGDLIWRKTAAPDKRRITSNRKIISLWPVRTGVLVHNGKALFASSLVPWETSLVWNVDAATGETGSDGSFRQAVAGVTLQGALLASSDRIYVPQGRAAPLAFDLADGDSLGAVGEAGGVFCILTEDEMLLAGPNTQKTANDEIRIADGNTRQRMASFSGTNRILVAGQHAWVPSDGKLKMLDRKIYVDAQAAIDRANLELKQKKQQQLPLETAQQALATAKQQRQSAWQWEVECSQASGFMKAGDAILIGSSDQVNAYSAVDGRLLWSADVEGVAHGLAVADGRLFVSTGLGHIYAFGTPR